MKDKHGNIVWDEDEIEAISETVEIAIEKLRSENKELRKQIIEKTVIMSKCCNLAKKSVFDDIEIDVMKPLYKRFDNRLELVLVSQLIRIIELGIEELKKEHLGSSETAMKEADEK